MDARAQAGHRGLALVACAQRWARELAKLAAAREAKPSQQDGAPPGSGRAVALSLRALRADIEAAVVQTAAQTTLLALGASALPAFGWIASERGRAETSAGGEPPGGGGEGRGGGRAAGTAPAPGRGQPPRDQWGR